ncbi:hypothetical protein Tco_0539805 [Tanacetum coccineum]
MKVQNFTWFKEKMLLAQVQEAGIALSKEHLAILADIGDRVDSLLGAYLLKTNPIFQSDGIDLYDSDSDDISTAKAKAQRIKPTLYDGSVISSQHVASPVIDDEETLILEEVKLSVEQAFLLQTSHPNTGQSTTSPVKTKAPKELPMVSLVNTCLKKLKYHLGKFDTVVKKRITPAAITEGESVSKSKVIAPVVHKLDLEPLSSKLKNNREAHVDYIRISKEIANTLRDIVEQARTSNPLDNALAYACMYTKQIQKLLVYVSDTCPSSPLKSEKLVAATPMNKARKVTFAKISATSEINTKKE